MNIEGGVYRTVHTTYLLFTFHTFEYFLFARIEEYIMMASNHSLLRNDTISIDRASTTRRRKKHPFMSNHHNYNHRNRNAISDIEDISNVQLEQAIRSLQCFEGLQEHQDTSYRSFALEYIESILRRWSHQVEQQSQKLPVVYAHGNSDTASHPVKDTQLSLRQPLQDSLCTEKSNETRSFAAVVAAGNIKSHSSFTRTTIPGSNSMPISTTKAGPTQPNAWNHPPLITRNNDENIQKHIPNAWNRPSTIIPLTVQNIIDPIIPPALIPFGSYRLGVHSITSDLDLLTLAPPYITRHDFFTSLVSVLQNDTRCKNVHPIPTAYTPVIKFVLQCGDNSANSADGQECQNIHIDLVFARITDTKKLVEYHKRKTLHVKGQLAVQYCLDDTDLQDQDEIGVRSLNGARVTQMILESVRNDVRKFQIVLCAVKQWAQVRGVYSNVLGFLGGVNWAILVAWVCKHYPNVNVSKTLQIFFDVFSKWQWNTPVLLCDSIADTPPICNHMNQMRAIQLPAWNPSVNPRDGLHLMPIITPAYPSMNSSYNVDFPQLRCMQHEMLRTNAMLSRSRSPSPGSGNIYAKLFESSDFFQRHHHFIQINISSTNESDFTKWFRFVESKLRNLISSLETTEVHAWPFARFFDVPQCHSEIKHTDRMCNYEKCFFIGLRFAPGTDAIDVRHLTMDFLHKVNRWDGRNEPTMCLTLAYLSAGDIPFYVKEAMKADNVVKAIVPIKTISLCNSKDGSINSENTAPASDDEDDDYIDLHGEFCAAT